MNVVAVTNSLLLSETAGLWKRKCITGTGCQCNDTTNGCVYRGKAVSRETRRPLVYKICMWRVAGVIFGHFHLMLAICDYMSRNGSCPQRDDWRSVALPLQSYRSTAAGVSSSAPPRCSLPDSFCLLLFCPIKKLPVATYRRLLEMTTLTMNSPTFHTLLFPSRVSLLSY